MELRCLSIPSCCVPRTIFDMVLIALGEDEMYEEHIKELFNNCKVGRPMGIEICEVAEGFASGRLTLREDHLNVLGIVHGGIIFTFADHVGGVCGNTLGRKAVLVESTIRYTKAVFAGDTLLAEARLTNRDRRTGRIDIKVQREGGEAVAFIHMLFFLTNDEHGPKTSHNL
jgi:acyl-CoA thioesterase